MKEYPNLTRVAKELNKTIDQYIKLLEDTSGVKFRLDEVEEYLRLDYERIQREKDA